jgi:hypothetical protein
MTDFLYKSYQIVGEALIFFSLGLGGREYFLHTSWSVSTRLFKRIKK